MRRVFQKRRAVRRENGNGQFTASFAVQGAVPTTGRAATRRFARGATLVDQLTRWHRHDHGRDLRVGLDPALKAA